MDLLSRPDITSPLVIGLFLLAAPIVLPSAGVLPTGGAILVGLTLGRVMKRIRRRRGDILIGLGAGIALGALFTHWSTATNFLFLLGGAIVAVQGFALSRRSDRARALSRHIFGGAPGGGAVSPLPLSTLISSTSNCSAAPGGMRSPEPGGTPVSP